MSILMKRIFVIVAMALACLGFAQETYIGLFMQGNKIGYQSYLQSDDVLDGKPVKRGESRNIIDAALLGSAMQMEIFSTSWIDAAGKPLKMRFVTTSAGRTQTLEAVFKGRQIMVDVDNGGSKTKKTLDVPQDGEVVDDPLTPILSGGKTAGKKKIFYILDPTTASLVKNELEVKGPVQIAVKGKKVSATCVVIHDPRMDMTLYLSSKGDLIKAEAAMGIEMIPITKEEALGKSAPAKPNSKAYKPPVDLAVATSIKTNKPIKDPGKLGFLKMKISGRDLSKAPSDIHQSWTGKGTVWTVTVHPPKLAESAGLSIAEAGRSKPEWLKPDLHIPSDTDEFKTLAKEIVGTETNSKKAALKIKGYVQRSMSPNAGIAMLRDASEVLKTKEGVCRDYAILTVTLMRSAGIPSRLASGLVNWDGNFYYHAWAEIWDGKRWLGMDSTTPDAQISASHVKLSDGNVDKAFNFTFLSKVKIEVLEARR
jgi:hypothetical protein